MKRLSVEDMQLMDELDTDARSKIRGGLTFGVPMQALMDALGSTRTRGISVEGGTIKTGDYEVGNGDTGPSDDDLLRNSGWIR